MRKFTFRLQALFDTTQQRERSIRHDLVRAESIESRIRAQLEAMLLNAAEWEERVRESQRGKLDHKRLHEQLGALRMLQKHIARQRLTLTQARRETEKVRHELTEAAQKRKALERLRERTEEQHVSECAAQQVRVADEMASTRAANDRIRGANGTVITGVLQ